MALKENDFVRITFTAKTKEDGRVFDTTEEAVAKENGLGERGPFGPQIVCLGQGFMLVGLEKKLIGQEKGKHTIELSAEEAFGKKNTKLIQLFPTSKFVEQKVRPEPGIVVNIDGHLGMIKTVTGGRTIVDFNHPLSGKDVVYEVDVLEVVTDTAEKTKAWVQRALGDRASVKVEENKATITLPKEVPKQLADQVAEKMKQATGVKEVSFKVKPETPSPAENPASA